MLFTEMREIWSRPKYSRRLLFIYKYRQREPQTLWTAGALLNEIRTPLKNPGYTHLLFVQQTADVRERVLRDVWMISRSDNVAADYPGC